MQLDFHYYATYCAAYLAGRTHGESLKIAYAAQFVDCCSRSYLAKIGGPSSAATTQLQLELMDARTDLIGLQDITRIWASFHFLPGDLYAKREKCSRRYLKKYRLICQPNGALLTDTVELARGKGCEAAGVAMHVLADTWAHHNFAGTPSLVINDTNYDFTELVPSEDGFEERPVRFNRNPKSPDDPETSFYTNSLHQNDENSIMNLGHGRAGHLPDYSFARYKYMPAWGDYREYLKDNPADYRKAFGQMVYALQNLWTEGETFEADCYAEETVKPWDKRIGEILEKRQLDACADWKAFAEELSGCPIPDFDIDEYEQAYKEAGEGERDETFLGRFIMAALAQKSLVTNRIFTSGSTLAGISIDFETKGLKGIRDFHKLAEQNIRSNFDD